GGIFWLSAGDEEYSTWQHELARLARGADYSSHSEDEERLASAFSRYLAECAEALLIIDDMKSPRPITHILPGFAGTGLNCTIVYTALEQRISETRTYRVQPFSEEVAMTALLQDVRPSLLQRYRERAWENE